MTLNPSEKNAFVAVNNLLKIAKVKVTETTLKTNYCNIQISRP